MLEHLNLKKLYYIFIILSIFSLSKNYAYTQEICNNIKTENIVNQKRDCLIKDHYILGSGDSIYIKFSGIDIFSSNYTIDPNGYLYLPELNYVLAKGKTIGELKVFLINKYKDVIIDPDLNLHITTYRPLNVVIKGEVKKPGLYKLTYNSSDNLNQPILNPFNIGSTSTKNQASNSTINNSPRLFDALKMTEGITNYADLSTVQIIRENIISNGGGKITTKLNFLSLLSDGNQSINIRIMDGDTIIVPRGERMLKEQILSLNKSNLTPDFITVYISGNVTAPGAMKIKQGSSLIQGIYQAGGERYFTGKIKHLRFNEFGNTEKNIFNLDLNASVNSKNNPILLDGDIVHINRTLLGKTAEAVQNISSPILSTYGIINIFE